MYHAHFALREEPFGVSPDHRFFLQTEQHREALATLYYAIRQRRGFALLLGRAGLGKTSVLVQLIQMLEGDAETAYLPHPYFDRSNVLESILLSLGLNATGSLAQDHRLFYKFLTRARQTGKTCVVIFDEAQDLNRDTLETIRMLSNFETPSEKLVHIVLAGQPRLAETLEKPECEQLRQRLNVIARLAPLTDREVHEYVSHRLNAAGTAAKLFTPAALDAVAAASRGVPRNVNTICFNALTLAYAVGGSQVGAAEVAEALRDLDLTCGLAASMGAERPLDVDPSRLVQTQPAPPWPVVTTPVLKDWDIANSPPARSASVPPLRPVSVPRHPAPAQPEAGLPVITPPLAAVAGAVPDVAAVPPSILGFHSAEPSFRSVFIAGCVTLLVAGTLLLRGLS